jgi:flagellar biosynthesis protein FlhA
VRIRDNTRLEAGKYVVKLKGQAVAEGVVYPDKVLAMDTGNASGALEGLKTKEPAFGLPAVWIPADERGRAEGLGYAIAEPARVLATHLSETVKKHAHELLTRDEVNNLMKTLKETSPSVVEEVVPGVLKPGEVQKVLQNLLKEGVSIRDLGTILETLGDYGPRTKDPEILTEYVRNALSRSLSQKYLDRDGRLYVITLDPKLEDLIKAGIERTERGSFLSLSPSMVSRVAERIGREVEKLVAAGHAPVILTSPQVRAAVKRIADTIQPGIAALSYNEILRDVKVESLGMVGLEAA